jgi:hypothetical protein
MVALLAQIKRKEPAVGIVRIIAERLAFHDAMFAVQGDCGLEIIP